MTADRFAALRAALDAGPTLGPWSVSEDYPRPIAILSDEAHIAHIHCEDTHNARYIAACDPDTIRALLAEYDALRAEAERFAHLIAHWDDFTELTNRNPGK